MRKVGLGLTVLVLALAAASPAAGTPRFGVSEDLPKYTGDWGASVFSRMRAIGMREIRITVTWKPEAPTTIWEQDRLDRVVALAGAYGVRVVFSVNIGSAWALASDTATRIALYSGYLQKLARRYPSVSEFIIANEPNERRFWQPQFGPGGEQVSGAAYLWLLASAYDALKAVNPGIVVVAGGISNEANDRTSTSPVRFIKAMGDAYRASGRTAPVMDQLGFHLYPSRNTDSPSKSYDWPNVNVADLDRIKQAIWDAFNGTAQPTFAETGQAGDRFLTLKIDELGWQAEVGPAHAHYHGVENVPPVGEEEQARIYAEVVRTVSCDATVADLLIFHLVDEPDLARFQSGLLRADGSARPSYAAVGQAIAQAGSCPAPHTWSHTTGVVGAGASFDARDVWWKQAVFGLSVTAAEEATARAGIFRVSRRAGLTAEEAGRALASAAAETSPVRSETKLVKAGHSPRLELRGRLEPGSYVLAVRLVSTMNPNRSQTLVSRIFRVTPKPAKPR